VSLAQSAVQGCCSTSIRSRHGPYNCSAGRGCGRHCSIVQPELLFKQCSMQHTPCLCGCIFPQKQWSIKQDKYRTANAKPQRRLAG
jgi:hypothetical protein